MRSVFFIVVLFVALAVFGPLLAPKDPLKINIPNRLSNPSADWWLGTDALGRDFFTIVTRGSLVIGPCLLNFSDRSLYRNLVGLDCSTRGQIGRLDCDADDRYVSSFS